MPKNCSVPWRCDDQTRAAVTRKRLQVQTAVRAERMKGSKGTDESIVQKAVIIPGFVLCGPLDARLTFRVCNR